MLQPTHELLAKARQIGIDTANDVEWLSRNSGRDVAREFLEIGSPLSGNWEEGITAVDLYREMTGNYSDTTGEETKLLDAIAEAHEQGFAEQARALGYTTSNKSR